MSIITEIKILVLTHHYCNVYKHWTPGRWQNVCSWFFSSNSYVEGL